MVLDWSHFPPRPAAGAPTRPPTAARAQTLRPRSAKPEPPLPPEKLIAASITGPGLATAQVAAASAPAPGVGNRLPPHRRPRPGRDRTVERRASLGGTPPRGAGQFGHGGATDVRRPVRPQTPVAPGVATTLKAAAEAVIGAGAGLVWIVEDPYRAVAANDLVRCSP